MPAKRKAPAKKRAAAKRAKRTTPKKPGEAGRPPLLSPERQHTIVETVRLGNTLNVAAQAAHIGTRTLFSWLERGRAYREHLHYGGDAVEAEQPYMQFLHAVEVARSEAERAAVNSVMRAAMPREVTKHRTVTERFTTGDGEEVTKTIETQDSWTEFDWRAAAWYLQHARPADWSETARLEVSGPEGGPIQVETLEEQRARVLAVVAELAGHRELKAQARAKLAEAKEAGRV